MCQEVLDMALDAQNTSVNNPEKFSAIMDPMGQNFFKEALFA